MTRFSRGPCLTVPVIRAKVTNTAALGFVPPHKKEENMSNELRLNVVILAASIIIMSIAVFSVKARVSELEHSLEKLGESVTKLEQCIDVRCKVCGQDVRVCYHGPNRP
jgi:hypothetical protein